MKLPFPSFLLLILGLLLPLTKASAQIDWAPSLEEALKQAGAEKKVVAIVLNMDGERANDRMVADHYQDDLLVKLSRHTVNLFCSNDTHSKSGTCSRCKAHTCQQHRNNDFSVRRTILGLDGTAPVVAPQHIFVGPDGKIIHSAPYYLTKGELEWMWVEAIRAIDPTFAWEASERIRAPEQFRKGAAEKSKAEPMPTREELQKALENLKNINLGGRGRRGGGGGGGGDFRRAWEDALKNASIVLRSDDKRALDWGKSTLRSNRWARNRLLREIGEVSPKAWASVIEEFLDHRDDATRRRAVIALEKMANPRSVAPLRKQVTKEVDPTTEGRIHRAMAACGPADRGTIQLITKSVKSHKLEEVRAHAVAAASRLDDLEAVRKIIAMALQDAAPLVRSVAAYAAALRQDERLGELIASSLTAETDDKARHWLDKAQEALRTKDPAAFRDFLAETLDTDEAQDENPFGGRGPRNGDGEGEGDGGDEDGGDGKGGGTGEAPDRGGRRRR